MFEGLSICNVFCTICQSILFKHMYWNEHYIPSKYSSRFEMHYNNFWFCGCQSILVTHSLYEELIMQSWHDQPLDGWPQHVTNPSRRDNQSRPLETLRLLINWLKFWFVGLKLVVKQVLVSTRLTAMKQMKSLKYKWHQEEKLAYNSLFLLHIFLKRNYMEDHEVWLL